MSSLSCRGWGLYFHGPCIQSSMCKQPCLDLRVPRCATGAREFDNGTIVTLALQCFAHLAGVSPWRSAVLPAVPVLLQVLQAAADSNSQTALCCLISLATGQPGDWMPAVLPAFEAALSVACERPPGDGVVDQALALVVRMLPWMDLSDSVEHVTAVLKVVHLALDGAINDSAPITAIAQLLPYLPDCRVSTELRQALLPACVRVLRRETSEVEAPTVSALNVLALAAMHWGVPEDAAASWLQAVMHVMDGSGYVLGVARSAACCLHNLSYQPAGAKACRDGAARLLSLLLLILETHGTRWLSMPPCYRLVNGFRPVIM